MVLLEKHLTETGSKGRRTEDLGFRRASAVFSLKHLLKQLREKFHILVGVDVDRLAQEVFDQRYENPPALALVLDGTLYVATAQAL